MAFALGPPLEDATNQPRSLRQARLDGYCLDGDPVKAAGPVHAGIPSTPERAPTSSALDSVFAHGSPSSRPSDAPDASIAKRLRSSRPRNAYDSSDDELPPSPARQVVTRRRRVQAGGSSRATSARGDLLRSRVAPAHGHARKLSHVDHFDLASIHVSHEERDVYRIVSEQPTRDWATPYACAFSNASRSHGKRMLALSDEEGTVTFVDVDAPATFAHERLRATINAHDNAVFDVKWSNDDRIIATASGDQTVGITDVTTQRAIGRLVGHTGTVKQVAWDPHNQFMISTASRDGSIRLWDIRVPTERQPAACNTIRNAHGDGKAKRPKNGSRSSARSVTTITYLQQRENLLASGGSADGVVKVWDLRRSHSKRVNPDSVAASVDLTLAGRPASRRPHGISSLALSPDGVSVYALGTDSTVYGVQALGLELDIVDAPPAIWRPPVSAGFASSSFYVRMSVSPCGRWIGTGSTIGGGAYIWDAADPRRRPIRLQGHDTEVSGIDWAADALATCADDARIRLWRPDLHFGRMDSHDPAREAYAGAVDYD